tara:strand:+ start:268 stop:540 length:273 start_codon:yes stop_codon:yes gene_type:complete
MKITKEDEFIDILQRFTTDENYNELDVVDAIDTYAKEQVIKELIWLMGETPINTDETPDALNVLVIEERCEKIEQELKQNELLLRRRRSR